MDSQGNKEICMICNPYAVKAIMQRKTLSSPIPRAEDGSVVTVASIYVNMQGHDLIRGRRVEGMRNAVSLDVRSRVRKAA